MAFDGSRITLHLKSRQATTLAVSIVVLRLTPERATAVDISIHQRDYMAMLGGHRGRKDYHLRLKAEQANGDVMATAITQRELVSWMT